MTPRVLLCTCRARFLCTQNDPIMSKGLFAVRRKIIVFPFSKGSGCGWAGRVGSVDCCPCSAVGAAARPCAAAGMYCSGAGDREVASRAAV